MTNTTTASVTYKDYTEYIIAEKIWIIVSPILIVVGTVTNVLSIVVLARKRMRSSTTMFYLLVLAIGDIMVLCTGLMRYWLKYALDVDVRVISQFGCKFHAFLVYFSLDFTTWILVAVTIDRCIFVCLPFKAKQLCTMFHARVTTAGIAALMFAVNFHLFWGVEIIVSDGEYSCEQSNHFTAKVWPWIDFCIFSVLPFTFMIISNVCIIRKIIKSHRKVTAHREAEASRTISDVVDSAQQQNKHPVKTKTRLPSVTAMLLSVNCVFLLLTLPIVVYLVVMIYFDTKKDSTEHEKAIQQLSWAIVNILQYGNNSIHFFLYCLTGPRFRKELFNLFGRARSGNQSLDHSVTLEMH